MSFKVRCVSVNPKEGHFTLNKVYEVESDKIYDDYGKAFTAWSHKGKNAQALIDWFAPCNWLFEEVVEEKKMFTKKDLKNGDVILRANGEVSIFIENLEMFVSTDGWMPLDKVCDDLTHHNSNREWDIVEVRRPKVKYECQFGAFRNNLGELVYDRERDTKRLYNGKVICIENHAGNSHHYTVGKIYQFVDGKLTTDHGGKLPHFEKIYSFEDWEKYSNSKFLEVKE